MTGPGGGRQRVVITGVGLVSGLATTTADHQQRLWAGDSGAQPLADGELSDLPLEYGVPVPGFQPRQAIGNRMLRKVLPPSAAYAVAAAGQAIADAGPLDEAELERAGVYLGSVSFELGVGYFAPALRASYDAEDRFDFRRFATLGLPRIDPLLIVKGLPNAALSGIEMEHGVKGPNLNLANGPASGLQAVAAAAAAIGDGIVSMALAGGADSLLQVHQLIALHLRNDLRTAVEPRVAARPFDRDRDGFLVGEGAALMMLESADSAARRGAKVYGEITAVREATGFADDEQPAQGLIAAARIALAEARNLPRAVFCDGLGTEESDSRDAAMASQLLPPDVHLCAATGALGYLGAAGGAFSLAHGALAMRSGELPPTVGCRQLDDDLQIQASDQPGLATPDSLLITTQDRGRKNVALVLERAQEPALEQVR